MRSPTHWASKRASFWWRVRLWWHMPEMKRMCSRTDLNFVLSKDWNELMGRRFLWASLKHSMKTRPFRTARLFVLSNIRILIGRFYWAFRWWLPFRCNGNHGGWQTDVCDWLEGRARYYEGDWTERPRFRTLLRTVVGPVQRSE